MPKIQRALLSVTDKTGVADFAAGLHVAGRRADLHRRHRGAASRGRHRRCAMCPRSPAFRRCSTAALRPSIRVIAGGVLAIRGNAEHMAALAAHAIGLIDMVVVNLYAFEKVAAKQDATVRRADREHRHRRSHHDPRSGEELSGCGGRRVAGRLRLAFSTELRASGGAALRSTHWDLAQEGVRADRRATIARSVRGSTSLTRSLKPRLPPTILTFARRRTLSSALRRESASEAALYSCGSGGHCRREAASRQRAFLQQSGRSGRRLAAGSGVHRPAAAIIKHTNPCGCAEQATPCRKRIARRSRPIRFRRSAVCSRSIAPLDEETATEIVEDVYRGHRRAGILAGGAGRSFRRRRICDCSK